MLAGPTRLAADGSALQRLQPRKQKAVLIHALDRKSRKGLHMSIRVLGQNDIHGMGLIKGMHHLDSIAQRAREEHDVVDGGSESGTFVDSNGGAGCQHLGRDQLRSHWACHSGSLMGAAHGPAPDPVEQALGVGCYG